MREGGSRNHQDIVFFTVLAEFFFHRPPETLQKDKMPLGLDALKAQILKAVVEQVPVPVICLQIHLGVQARRG